MTLDLPHISHPSYVVKFIKCFVIITQYTLESHMYVHIDVDL